MGRTATPYGLPIIQSCVTCPVREQRLFCNLGAPALEQLNAIRQSSVYPAGAVLFVEGQPARGLFVVCSGKVKLTTSSPTGKTLILRIAEPGEVLGLSAVVANTDYEVNGETLEPTQVSFVSQVDFLRFLQQHGEVSLRVAEHLSVELRHAYHQLARIALAPTARAKLASLLVDMASHSPQPTEKGARFQLHLSHEEVGELIGSSRETVTRLLNEFRRKKFIETKGAWVILTQPAKLKALLS